MKDRRLAYHGKYARASAYCLLLWLLFGFVPLAAWWTGRGTPANLALAGGLGAPALAAALYFLFKYRALVVFPDERRLVTVDGGFRFRRKKARSFDEVAALRLRFDVRDQADMGSRFIVDLLFRDGSVFLIEEPTRDRGIERVKDLAGVFGVRGYENDTLIADPRPGEARPV